jgi:hypothetical protein
MTAAVGTVGLHVNLLDSERRPVEGTLGLDNLEPEVSQVAFVDTPDLALLRGGVVIRARRTQDRAAGVAVTLLWADPAGLPPALRGLPGFTVEVDARPVGFACSCTVEVPVADRCIDDLLAGRVQVHQVLSTDQRWMLSTYDSDVRTGLTVFGPLYVLTHRLAPPGLRRGAAVERWYLPDDSRHLRLATQCTPGSLVRTTDLAGAHLRGLGVEPDPTKETATRAALVALAAASNARRLSDRPG